MLNELAPSPGPRPGIDPPRVEAPDPSGLWDRFMSWDGAWPAIIAVLLAVIGIGLYRRHTALFAFFFGVAIGFFVGGLL